MTSDIVSVEIGRSTWQGPAEEAPRRAMPTHDDSDDCYMEGFNAGFGEAMLAQDVTEKFLRTNLAKAQQEIAGMRALLLAGCELLEVEAEGLRDGISINGVMCPCPEDQATVEAIREMEDWIASVKATLRALPEGRTDV